MNEIMRTVKNHQITEQSPDVRASLTASSGESMIVRSADIVRGLALIAGEHIEER